MLFLLLLFFIGIDMSARPIYWIVWGVAFTIETINMFSMVRIDIDESNEEDNDK